MPHATVPEYQHIQVTELAPTFGAEVSGIDFTKPVPPEVFQEISDASAKYGVLVFRKAGLDDARHVEFSRLFGELDDVKPYMTLGRINRFPFLELFDVSNQEDDGSLVQVGSKRDIMGRGNGLFHCDSAFNPRRAGYSLLRAHELPPPGHGGNTDFADTRTAFDDLPEDLKTQLLDNDYIGANSLWHSRRKAAPDSEFVQDFDPEAYPFGRHRIVQLHERSGRTNLYIANHLHHLEYKDGSRVPEPESTQLIERLLAHATQDKYVISVEWRENGDVVCWDNTAVMHRASVGSFAGRYKRDMRRTTVHDSSSQAWGLNERTTKRMGLP
ncbi:alpha-ketoglutarate-dependent 2,4-dichlorophenoxyacetate dioxygenase [Exophiala viscosa]|uniref:alpha-ketoglutarate-dependent 2,4-dichlorophenoxyacetate dioxygenase n=1 Tax=Exophiala viscosa TaxID=2486360 RepID=UPI002195E225|nr:alpha-ketoglutarate-dependent 2,4-dichlorophenoxyacetate dioxygenase [Exophiala viscosa]